MNLQEQGQFALASASSVIFLCALILGYVLPTLVAVSRKHNNAAPIALVNVFFGVTFVGWWAALIWACTDNVRS